MQDFVLKTCFTTHEKLQGRTQIDWRTIFGTQGVSVFCSDNETYSNSSTTSWLRKDLRFRLSLIFLFETWCEKNKSYGFNTLNKSSIAMIFLDFRFRFNICKIEAHELSPLIMMDPVTDLWCCLLFSPTLYPLCLEHILAMLLMLLIDTCLEPQSLLSKAY